MKQEKRHRLIEWAIDHPRIVIFAAILFTVILSIPIPRATIDTDPENMLAHDEPVRIAHDRIKVEFGLSDHLVIGFTGETALLTTEFVAKLEALVDSLSTLEGVIADDIIAPSTVDDIYRTSTGELVVGPLTRERVEVAGVQPSLAQKISENPLLNGKLASDDGMAVAIYVPLSAKKFSHPVAERAEELIISFGGMGQHHLAGLPIAEETFGIEMFRQMAISAPMAGLLIFLLMFFFFRNLAVVAAPMILAMMTVIWTMGLLILCGFTVHIMSSMIPIFLMPVAVLDSVHVLSEFHDHYRRARSRREAILTTVNGLYWPMFFTALTTVVGFASLGTAPIPPVRVFGIFVAIGVGVAFLLTITFIPAYAMLLSEKRLANFGNADEGLSPLARMMSRLGTFAIRRKRWILTATVGTGIVAAYGISRIEVDDNPTMWFQSSHPIRVAERELGRHLAGTYLSYLEFDATETQSALARSPETMQFIEGLQRHLEGLSQVGATTGVTDIVKKVRFELKNGDSSYYSIPDSGDEIAQELFLYESSGGDPGDLFKFITPAGDKAVLWVQMQNGNNRSMQEVVDAATVYTVAHAPNGLATSWGGLTYINVVWQDRMVVGMLNSLLGSLPVELLILILVLRSIVLGVIAIIPLSVTIAFVYGAIGLVGKPYDMPIAVLSSLALGLSTDLAIHFLKRGQEIYQSTRSLSHTMAELYQEPARASFRNIIVIALGFLPLLFSNLMPYVTVSAFFIAIMCLSGLATLLVFPGLLALRGERAFWWWGAKRWAVRKHQSKSVGEENAR